MPSLPPISSTVRLIHICPGTVLPASSLMRSPTSFEPVNPMYRVFGCCTSTSPIALPGPVIKFTASFGMPASKRMSINFAAIVGESAAGFRTTVFPVTSDATVIPAMIAHGNLHKGVALLAHGCQLLRLAPSQHLAAVQFQKVDRYGNVRGRLRPRLPHSL